MNRRAKYKKNLTVGGWRASINNKFTLPDGREVFVNSSEASWHFWQLAMTDMQIAKTDYSQQPQVFP